MSDFAEEEESGGSDSPTVSRSSKFSRQFIRRRERKSQPRFLTVTGGIVRIVFLWKKIQV